MRAAHFLMIFAVAGCTTGEVIAEDELDEAKAIAKFELLGGKVTRNESLPREPVVGVSFKQKCRFNHKYFHLLKPFKNLTSIDLHDVPITVAGLKEVSELTKLTKLQLYRSEITNEGLIQLLDLRNLTELTLHDTSVTWVGLIDVRESLPKVRIVTVTSGVKRIGIVRNVVGQAIPDEIIFVQSGNPLEAALQPLRSGPFNSP